MSSLSELKNLIEDSRNIDFYSDIYSDLDLSSLESMSDFREMIPVIDKDRLLEYYTDGDFSLDSDNIEGPVLARPTSGTTSELACYYRGDDEIQAHCDRFVNSSGKFFESGKNKDRVMIATTFSLNPILARQFTENGCLVTCNSPFDIERTAEVMKTIGCNVLVASPPVALKISKRLNEEDYRGLEKYYFVSSGLSELTKARFREIYPEAEIMLQYGLAETGILMKQCEDLKGGNRYHCFEDDSTFHYEFVTDDNEEASPGEIGEIIITKFHEKTPLIRYNVGDLFEVQGICECGNRIYRFVGRKEDKFKIKGVTVFKERIEDALQPFEGRINHYQIIIDEEDGELPKPKIRLKVEAEDRLDEDRLANIFSDNFDIAEEYSWSKGVEMGLFGEVEVVETEFEDRKFRQIIDRRYS